MDPAAYDASILDKTYILGGGFAPLPRGSNTGSTASPAPSPVSVVDKVAHIVAAVAVAAAFNGAAALWARTVVRRVMAYWYGYRGGET